jgi:membrane protein
MAEQQEPPPEAQGPVRRRLHQTRKTLHRLLNKDVRDLTHLERRAAYVIRLVVETWREVLRDDCQLRAAALAYITLLSLVPLTAVAMSILANFETGREQLLNLVVDTVYPVDVQEERTAPPGTAGQGGDGAEPGTELQKIRVSSKQQLRDWMDRFTSNASQVGVVGFLVLVFFFIWTLRTVELSFNAIWNVSEGRPLSTQVARYSALLIWGPLLVLLTLSLTTYMHTATALQELPPQWLRGWIFKYVLPYIATFIAFASIYFLLPNTRVRLRPGVIGAAIAALLFAIGSHAFQYYVANVPTYSRIFGTLSVVPVMMLWLYISWVIILFGSEIAFVAQNFEDLRTKQARIERGIRWRTFYGVRMLVEIGERYLEGTQPPTAEELSHRFSVPEYVVIDVLNQLRNAGLIVRTSDTEDIYLPKRDLGVLKVADVVDALGGEALEFPTGLHTDAMTRRIGDAFGSARSAAAEALSLPVRDLAQIGMAEDKGEAPFLPPPEHLQRGDQKPQTQEPAEDQKPEQ